MNHINPEENIDNFCNALEGLDGVLYEKTGELMKGNLRVNVTLPSGHVVSVSSACNYNGTMQAYGRPYKKVVYWSNIKTGISSLKRKIKQIDQQNTYESERQIRERNNQETEERVLSELSVRHGGKSKCAYFFNGEFSLRLKFTPEQLMEFFDKNQDFISDEGKWIGQKGEKQ